MFDGYRDLIRPCPRTTLEGGEEELTPMQRAVLVAGAAGSLLAGGVIGATLAGPLAATASNVPIALSTTRAYLASNLTEPLGSNQATAVAEAAEITVVNETPGIDPFTGMRLDRPSICARIRVPYRLDLLGFVGAIGTGQMTLASNAQIRP
jgi:hypothetical protein